MKTITELIQELREKTKYVDIIVTYNKEEILLLRRANYLRNFKSKWCMPGGHMDKNENSEESVLRELKEETSIELTQSPEFLFTYNYQNGTSTDVYYIDLDTKPQVKISREHSDYKWINFEELINYSDNFAGECYQIIKLYIENNFDKINETR